MPQCDGPTVNAETGQGTIPETGMTTIPQENKSCAVALYANSSQDAGPMGVNPMALLGQEGAQKDYYYYY
jgi:hypothetical protein